MGGGGGGDDKGDIPTVRQYPFLSSLEVTHVPPCLSAGIDMDDQGHSSQGRSSAEERTSADDKEQSSTDAPVSNGQAEPTSSES